MRRDRADDYHIYEINADGTGLRQLTFGSGVSATSTRSTCPTAGSASPRPASRSTACATGTSWATCSRWRPTGRTSSRSATARCTRGTRRCCPTAASSTTAGSTWTATSATPRACGPCNPDGTNHAIYYGNNTDSPGAVLDARPIPGTRAVHLHLLLLPRPAVGRAGDRRPAAGARPARARRCAPGRPTPSTWSARATTTRSAASAEVRGPLPALRQVLPLLADDGPGRADGHLPAGHVRQRDPAARRRARAASTPCRLAPRPGRRSFRRGSTWRRARATFYVADVYRGTGMETVARGTVKRLRVVESPEKRFWTGPAGTAAPASRRRAWPGTTSTTSGSSAPCPSSPTAAPTSPCPPTRFVYFQLLDERGMMVQSMRSGTIVRPGETAGCVGCHETAAAAVPVAQPARRPCAAGPSRLEPWYGPPRNFSYLAEVQPVFDEHCVALPRLRQAGGQEAQPGRRPEA